jgi:F-type H+-transporting ATPase subunit gamma
MANTIEIKRRIGSVKNTKQITKAMELVSASKMRRAQELAKRSREYRDVAYDLLSRLSQNQEAASHPLFQKRKVKSRLYIMITSNGVLAGAYNHNVIKMFINAVTTDQANGIKCRVITIGNQGTNFVRRIKDLDLIAAYSAFGDEPSTADILPILNTAITKYRNTEIDNVCLIYTLFKTNLLQEVQNTSLLPTDLDNKSEKPVFTNFEPSVETVLDSVTTRLLEAQIWQALLESMASEHSMRMLAMKSATDNASEIIDDLTLEFNTARQTNITQELAEISGGVEALK